MSTPIRTRADFQQLAEARLEEAKTLLDAGKWDGAYYLAGYAVEVALKACIITRLMTTDEFPEKKFSESCYTHKLDDLFKAAGLAVVFDAALAADPLLRQQWGFVRDWGEFKRYHRITEAEARVLYDAIADASHGVLSWIKTHY